MPCVKLFAFSSLHIRQLLTSKPVMVRINSLASSLISAVKTAILFVLWRRAQSFFRSLLDLPGKQSVHGTCVSPYTKWLPGACGEGYSTALAAKGCSGVRKK